MRLGATTSPLARMESLLIVSREMKVICPSLTPTLPIHDPTVHDDQVVVLCGGGQYSVESKQPSLTMPSPNPQSALRKIADL